MTHSRCIRCKNLSLAGGFLLLIVGAHGSLGPFLFNPFASSHPYAHSRPFLCASHAYALTAICTNVRGAQRP